LRRCLDPVAIYNSLPDSVSPREDRIYRRACSVRRSVFSELVTASPGKIARQTASLPSCIYTRLALFLFPSPSRLPFCRQRKCYFPSRKRGWSDFSLLKYLRARHRRKPSSFCSSFQSFFSSLLRFFARWFFLPDAHSGV